MIRLTVSLDYQAYRSSGVAWLRKHAMRIADAHDDILQDAFVKLLEKGGPMPRSLYVDIVAGLARNEARRAGRRLEVPYFEPNDESLFDFGV